MKRGFIFVLVMVMLLQSSIRSVYVAYYQLNQDYIASVLCINKAKPASTCKGKCYLSKKMKEQEKQEQTIPSIVKGLEEVVLYITDFNFHIKPVFSEDAQLAVLDAYQMHAYKSPADSIIQPPQ
jgi:hypothetical protein